MSTVPPSPRVHTLVPVTVLLVAVLLVPGCAGAPPARSPSDAIDLTEPESDREPELGAPLCYETTEAQAGCAEAAGASPDAPPAAPAPVDATVWRVPVESADPQRGPDDAWVTVVVFSDFECPYCRLAARVIERVEAAHPGALRVVWKDYPLSMHDRAEPAALFARAVRAQQGDAGFWKAHDRLFEQQEALSEADLKDLAGALDADWPRIEAAIRARTHAAPVVLGRHLGNKVAVDRTPTLFVNGRKIAGAPSFATLDNLVREEKEKARELVEEGVAPSALYDHIIRSGVQAEAATDLP